MTKIAIILISFAIISGCSTTSLTKQQKGSLRTVGVDYPVINKPLKVTCYLCKITWAGPYQGKQYFDANDPEKGLTKLHEDVYQNNDIDIKKIVYDELLKQLPIKTKLTIVTKDPDIFIRPVIEIHGYGQPRLLSADLSPKIVISLHGDMDGHKDALISKGIVTILSKSSEGHSSYDLVHNPQLILDGYTQVSEKAISEALESMF